MENFDKYDFGSEDDEIVNAILNISNNNIYWLLKNGYLEIKQGTDGIEYLSITKLGKTYCINNTLRANGRFDMRVK